MVNLFETVKVLRRSEAVIRKLSSVERFPEHITKNHNRDIMEGAWVVLLDASSK